jgi:periplasmic protein TonB
VPPPPAAPYASSAPARDAEPIADEAEEQIESRSTVSRLRFVRTSPWPVMVLVGVMALVTVSAIGLRSGSSSTTEPPAVVPPPATQPEGYAAQMPTAPLPSDQPLAPPSTAFGDAPWRPASPPANVPSAETAPVAVVPTLAPAKTPPPTLTKPAAPVASAQKTATPEPAAVSPTAGAEDPVAETGSEAVRVIEPPPTPPASTTEPRAETPAPAAAPPAVSSARPSTASAPVPELPKPAASRTMVPIVVARRLTGGMPEYSPALRQRKVSGVVDVQMRIDINGRVVSAIAVSGPPPLRQAAEAAVLKWRYAPATRNGIPIETESKVSFSFDPSQSRRQ